MEDHYSITKIGKISPKELQNMQQSKRKESQFFLKDSCFEPCTAFP
jgi:hypothetical protein